MANKKLFRSTPGKILPKATEKNEAGGKAYGMPDRHALAQFAATGCFGHTYYANADEQLEKVMNLAKRISQEPDGLEFLAKTAIYARKTRFMKDMPALLVAFLSMCHKEKATDLRAPRFFYSAFLQVMDIPKMLHTFMRILLSGAVGRKSLGTMVKKAVRLWFDSRTPEQIFKGALGQDPAWGDILFLAHVKGKLGREDDAQRDALYEFIRGKAQTKTEKLPGLVRQVIQLRKGTGSIAEAELPELPMQLLTSLKLSKENWKLIARRANWQTTRMNLQTFKRHEVFEDGALVAEIAKRLANKEEITRARVFPYQVQMAYAMAEDVPTQIQTALQRALEAASDNVPKLEGQRIVVAPDLSGSMQSPVTGDQGRGATTKVMCNQVTALFSAILFKKNAPNCAVLPFADDVFRVRLNPEDSIMTLAGQIARAGSGGTNCSSVMRQILVDNLDPDLVIYLSDNQSWADFQGRPSTECMALWRQLQARVPGAKLVLVDLQPNDTTQAPDEDAILNVGGFSDSVFELIAQFVRGKSQDHWVQEIEKQTI